MKIAYSWLKDYINFDLAPVELCDILTQTGLEVGGLEEVETIKGGLKGLVIGEVVTCEAHPNSDHLSKTTVNVGGEDLLPIVCGAPNVAAGQKVVVATVGTTLYDGDEEFKIKKSKIRGEVSMGMICAEDEIGVGTDHDGIMVLDADAEPGTPAADYFKIESDYVIEIDLTPNRIDGASVIGVARDLAAFLKQKEESEYTLPSVDDFVVENKELELDVKLENPEACQRYAGVTISGIEVKDSPEWLQNRLRLIGLSPINNIVDVTNYVLFELGQPLHAFDAAEIKGDKVVVKTLPAKTKFVTLDDQERELHENDLMICNAEEGMCIGGVFGGSKSGVKDSTTAIFLESARFDPVYIRKTARRHALNTDASFRFERGVDPNITIYALKRAALLIKEVAGGTISSDIVDIYPEPIENYKVEVKYKNVTRLIGEDLGGDTIKKIVGALEMEILEESDESLLLSIPPYRVDVQREADVIEDILRIYGFNNIEPEQSVNSTIQYSQKPNRDEVKWMIAEFLTSNGFNEIWSNSLTKSNYYEDSNAFNADETVMIFNPLSQDLNAMRQSLLFGGIEAISYNTNRQNADLKLYEFGNIYQLQGGEELKSPADKYHEFEHLGLFISGNDKAENWNVKDEKTTFYHLKKYVDQILVKLGFNMNTIKVESLSNDVYDAGLSYKFGGGSLFVEMGLVGSKVKKSVDADGEMFYADLHWSNIFKELKKNKVSYKELPKYPAVRRDLALLVDEDVQFSKLKELAQRTERKILREVGIFDVYKGDKLPKGKKSYGLSFILRDDEKTLNDKVIDKTMKRLIATYEREVNAQIR